MLCGYGDFMWTSGTWIALPFDFTSCALSDMEVQLPVIFRVSMFFRLSEWGLFFGGAPDIFKQLGFTRDCKFAGRKGRFLKEVLKSARLKVSAGLRGAKIGSR